MDRQGLIEKDTPANTSAMHIDPGAAVLGQTPCASCTFDINEVHQLRNLAANLCIIFHFLDCLLVALLHAFQHRSHQIETSFENCKLEKVKHLIEVPHCVLMLNFRCNCGI